MELRITTTPALIGIRTQPAKVKINNPQPILEMETIEPKLSIESEKPMIDIDQYECFAALGYKNFLDLYREQAQLAYENVLNYIGEAAEEGDRFAAIEEGGNPIADIAAEKPFRQPPIRVGAFPVPRPKYSVSGSLNIEYEPGDTVFTAHTYPVAYEVTPYKVDIYLRQRNSINIEYVGQHMDRRI